MVIVVAAVVVVAMVTSMVMVPVACCSSQSREEASDSLERMKPEDVYDSIRRTTADIRHYVKMESNTASPPSQRTGSVITQRREATGNGVAGGGAASYRLPVVRSPNGRTRQQYNQVIFKNHVAVMLTAFSGKHSVMVWRPSFCLFHLFFRA